jgi:apolipoprotein D and lipocalin family protein
MKKLLAVFLLGAGTTLGFSKDLPPPTVKYVELGRYLGKWYEIARLPMFAQKHCTHSTAEYSLNNVGDLRVENRCTKIEGSKSRESKKTATAWVVDEESNSKIKVRFIWWLPYIADGDYWILKLDDDYQISLVGTPNRKYLWLLARSPELPKKKIDEWISYAQTLGYKTENLIFANEAK